MLPLSGFRGCKNKPRDPEDFTLSGKGADGALWTDCTMMGREARRKRCTFGTLPGTHEQDGCFSDKSSVSQLQGLEGQRRAEGAEQSPCQCTPKLLQLPRKRVVHLHEEHRMTVKSLGSAMEPLLVTKMMTDGTKEEGV